MERRRCDRQTGVFRFAEDQDAEREEHRRGRAPDGLGAPSKPKGGLAVLRVVIDSMQFTLQAYGALQMWMPFFGICVFFSAPPATVRAVKSSNLRHLVRQFAHPNLEFCTARESGRMRMKPGRYSCISPPRERSG